MAARLRVGVADLLRNLGTRREFRDQIRIDDLGVVSTRVDPDADVDLEFFIEAFSGGISVTGRVEVPWTGECRRCLDEVRGTTVQHVQEIFGGPGGRRGRLPARATTRSTSSPWSATSWPAPCRWSPCAADCAGPSPDRFPTGPADEAAPRRRRPLGRPRRAQLRRVTTLSPLACPSLHRRVRALKLSRT